MQATDAVGAVLGFCGMPYWIYAGPANVVWLVLLVATLVGMMKVFEKAGRPGWEGLIPIYNLFVLIVEILGKEWWWILLCLIPCVQWVIFVILGIELAKRFGQDPIFGVGLG